MPWVHQRQTDTAGDGWIWEDDRDDEADARFAEELARDDARINFLVVDTLGNIAVECATLQCLDLIAEERGPGWFFVASSKTLYHKTLTMYELFDGIEALKNYRLTA